MSDVQTVGSVLDATRRWFQGRGVESPRRSIELLLQHVLGVDRLRLYLDLERPLSTGERDRLRALVARRGQHEPVAYLLGSWEFHGHELEVGPGVLVPRPETEELAEAALAVLSAEFDGADLRAVDLGTGSGALAIALAMARPRLHVVAVEREVDALGFAVRNVERHGLRDRVVLRQGSWWDALAADDGPFDLVVTNPPYVDPSRPELVADDVRRFEPGPALWTPPGEPGACYVAIAAGLAAWLKPGGFVLAETGEGAVEASREAFVACGLLGRVEVLDDLAGRPRILRARRRDS